MTLKISDIVVSLFTYHVVRRFSRRFLRNECLFNDRLGLHFERRTLCQFYYSRWRHIGLFIARPAKYAIARPGYASLAQQNTPALQATIFQATWRYVFGLIYHASARLALFIWWFLSRNTLETLVWKSKPLKNMIYRCCRVIWFCLIVKYIVI